MEADEKREREQHYAQVMAEESLCLEEFALWQERRSVQRTSASLGSIFVLWKLRADSRPDIVDAFEVTDIEMTAKHGISVRVESKRFSKLGYAIEHEPRLLAGDQEVFVWIPFFCNVARTPHPQGRNWLTRVEVCIRTKSHPRNEPTAGHTYLSPVGEFRSRFRDYAEVRF